MLTPYKSKRIPGRKRAILSIFAAFFGLLSWQHIEGLGLGDRHTRDLANGANPVPTKSEPPRAA